MLRAEGWEIVALDDGPPRPSLHAAETELVALGCEVLIAPDAGVVADTLARVDLVMASPGVRPDHHIVVAALGLGVPVRSEIDLAAERITAPIIAVTGTNGKTTTVEMITAMLAADGRTVLCGGNIGTPLITFAGKDADIVVAEVSSFQLHFVTDAFRPQVAVLLNIADDHLDWHGSFEAYRADKCRVFAAQQPNDVVILNVDDAAVHEVLASGATGEGRVVTVGSDADNDYFVAGQELRGGTELLATRSELPRALPHDLTNALVAAAAAMACGVSANAVREVLKNYATLPHRVQRIGENWGVSFYNDSKATNPHATQRAVEAFDSVVLLAGGLNKGLDLNSLRTTVPPVKSVVAFGAAQYEVESAFAGLVPVVRAASMSDAVRAGAAMARSGDVVLLSPGCASFDMYPGGYTERGDHFADIVRQLITEDQPT